MTGLDLASVRRFTDELEDSIRRCDNGEGMICDTLEKRISHYAKTCEEFRQLINQWARSVFSGEVSFDLEVETLLKNEARRLLHRANQVAAVGRTMNGQCFELQDLHQLHYFVADLGYLLENWVSPHKAVGPAPRLVRTLSDATKRQVMERLEKLSTTPRE